MSANPASWRAIDPDPDTVAELDSLIAKSGAGDRQAQDELAAAFGGSLQFGTAGLRGRMGPGPNRMNRVVVIRAAAGLAKYLIDNGFSGNRVIIGYDARHKSAIFATDTAQIMAGAGFEVLLAPGPVPTPVVAYGIRARDCVAGVVVTASHNPPQDNGYKVYLGDGTQIVAPTDAQIAAAIETVAKRPLDELPRADTWRYWDPEIITEYVTRAAELGDRARGAALRWVYSAMHGVGSQTVHAVVERAGIPAPIAVAEQAEPDPDFPTVAFPNPEEPGAIDLAVAAARAETEPVDVVIINDPDADRCAVAVDDGDQWRMLSGDQLGWLLADDALRRGVRGTYACSVVSSVLLPAMAAAHDQEYATTLTGFKWIGRVPRLAYGYEEAIGYCCDPDNVADKDGITALITVLAVAAELKAKGETLIDRLNALAATYGPHLTDQLSLRVDDQLIIPQTMARLRAQPPTALAGIWVTFHDLATNTADLPPTDALIFAGEGVRAVVRPSGTEPKLKCYLEVWDGPGSRVGTELPTRLARLRTDIAHHLG